MSEILKYPAGEWTHAEFADANGKTKPSVYNQLQDAIKNGTVVVCGSRSSGKGKPSKLYKVADANAVVVVVTKVDEFKTGDKTVEVFDVTPANITEKITEKAVKTSEETVIPITESVVVAEVVAEQESEEKIDTNPVVEVTPEMTQSKFTCPICHQPAYTWRNETGIYVMCRQPESVCSSTENPYGHARTEREAAEIMVQKFTYGRKNQS